MPSAAPIIRLALFLHSPSGCIGDIPVGAQDAPAYLDIRESRPGALTVPVEGSGLGNMRLVLDARLPDTCQPNAKPVSSIEAEACLER